MNHFKYVGHPFVDTGVSVMEIILEKRCEDFTVDDIEKAKQELIKRYDSKTLKSYLSTIFPNSAWANFNIGKEKKEENIKNLLYIEEEIEEKCFYCSNKANRFVNRQHIPLLSGENIINIVSSGKGLPVCKYCIASIQFFPLGTIKVEGNVLLWNTHNPDLSYIFTDNYYNKQKKLIDGAIDEKIESLKFPYTRLLESLQEALDKFLENNDNNYPVTDCIAYHFTNYGTSPDYKEYIIPSSFLVFLKKLKLNSELEKVYKEIIRFNWFSKNKKETEQKNKSNLFYNAIAKFLQNYDQNDFIRLFRFFINTKVKDLNSFSLVQLFLTEVVGMNKSRLEKIKEIADKIFSLNDEKFIKEILLKKYNQRDFIDYIVRIQSKLKKAKLDCFTMDDVCLALGITNSDDSTNSDFWLVRDLITIRLLEISSIQIDDIEVSDDLKH